MKTNSKMRKQFITILALVIGSFAFGQVGINNQAPKATLDVTAKTTDGSKPEGIIAPRLTGDQVKAGDAQYGTDQTGMIIYASSAVNTPSSKTVNITAAGYYYFDGNVWQKLSGSTTINNSTYGSIITKQRLITASPSVVINSGSGDFSFRYNSTGIAGNVQIKFNSSGTRTISVFTTENWTPNGYSVQNAGTTLASNIWTNIPGSTDIGQTGELNVFRIYDLNNGIIYLLEINLVNNGGVVSEAMILQEF